MGEMTSFLAIRTIGICGLLGSSQIRPRPCSHAAIRLSDLYYRDGVFSAVLRPSWITPLETSERLLVTLTDSPYTIRAVCLVVGSGMYPQIIVRYCWRTM